MKVTQKELAQKTGLAEITIRNYEAGKYKPKIEQLQKIAEVLGVSLEWLQTGQETIIADPINMSFQVHGSVRGTTDKTIIKAAKESISLDMEKLNYVGAREAAKRVHELTQIDEYMKKL